VEQLSIPPFANLGQPVAMGCSFDLGNARLYSVKWYKDNDEFCRYMPSQHPPSQLFPARGVVMDVSLNSLIFASSFFWDKVRAKKAESNYLDVDERNAFCAAPDTRLIFHYTREGGF
jgi:hypothetical protein